MISRTFWVLCQRSLIRQILPVRPWTGARGMASQSHSVMDGPSGKLAYVSVPGQSPGVVFLSGYGSVMTGTKATALQRHCEQTNRAFLRFDYRGCGSSEGDFNTATIGQWKTDVLAVLDELTRGPQILVGSSMGGWLMLLAALERPDLVAALVGVAAAPDFTSRMEYTDQVKRDLAEKGVTYYDTPYGQMFKTKVLLDEGSNHLLLDRASLPITCPVRLLHGMRDEAVPYQLSLDIAEKVASRDVEVFLRKDSDHRFCSESDLKLLTDTIDGLVK